MKFKLGLLIVVLYFVAPKAFAFFGSSLIVPDATHFEAKFQQCRPKKRQRSTKKLLQATIQKILDRKTLKKVKKYSLKQRSDIAKATRLLKTSTEIYFKDYKSAFVENSYLSSCALERKITHEMRLSGWSVNRKNKKQMRRFRQAHEKRYLKLRQQMNLPYCKGEWRKKYSQLRLRISPVLKSMRLSMALMESHWLDTFNQKNRQAMLKKIKKGKLPLVCGVNNVSVTQNIEHARGLGFRESYVNVSDYFSAPGVHNSYLGTIPEITPLTPRELQRVKRKIQEDAEEFSRFVHLDALRLKELKKRKKKPKFLAPKMTPSLGPALNKGWSFLTQDISLCTRFKKALHTFYEARYFMAIEAFPILGYINQPHFDESSKKWLPSNNQMFDGLYDLRSRAFEKLQELLFEEQKRQFRLKHIRVSHPRRGRVKLKVPATLEDVKGLSLKTVAWTQYLKWYKEDWSERRKAIAVVLNQHPKLCNIAERIDHMASPKKSWWRKKAEDALSFVPGLACSYAREELSVESGAACGLALLSKSTFQFVSRMKILAKKGRAAIYRPVLKDPLFQRSLSQLSEKIDQGISSGFSLALWGWSAVSPETDPSQFLRLGDRSINKDLFKSTSGALPSWAGQSVFNTILAKERRHSAKGICSRRQVSQAVRFAAEYPEVNSYAKYLKSADPKHGIPTDERFLLRGWFCAPVISRVR